MGKDGDVSAASGDSGSRSSGWWSSPTLAATVIVLGCLVSHGLSAKTYFCYDDFTWLKLARSWYLGQTGLFAPNPWNTFRPGTHLLWYIDYALFADRAVGYHVISILLYALNAVSVFALIRRLSGATGAAFLGALLFATGAGNSEAVQSSATQGFLAAGTLAVWCLILADKYVCSGKARLLVGSCLSCAAAMFAHEMAVVVPVGLVLYAVWFARPKSMKRFGAVLAIAGVAAAIWGTAYLGFYKANGERLLERGEPTLLTTRCVAANMGRAVPALFVPDVHAPALRSKLSAIFPGLVRPLDLFSSGLFVVILLGAVLAIVLGSPVVRLGVVWCLAGLFVGSLSELGFSGRYLYLPMVALGLATGPLLAGVLSASKGWVRGAVAVALAALILSNVATSVIGLIYRERYARERYRIISQLRQLHESDQSPIYITGLPVKIKDVIDAAHFYGIDVTRGDGRDCPVGALRFHYAAGGLVPGPGPLP